MYFKDGRGTGNGAYPQKGVTLRVLVANKPKVFGQMAPPVQEIMDSTSYSEHQFSLTMAVMKCFHNDITFFT
jgi:hypothetical protein